ncbi:hypothetical protein OG440_23515 [Streptomyces sp. NBC_00637]|uniref:hypothetical protein n=1 Tax=Streptomyces sp. NBC_00637 TaxID=2903667 RepID=UPI003253B27B
MRRGLVHVLAWSLATGAAVTLSWWGVHTVMAGTAYDPPRALPLTAGEAITQETKPPSSPPSSRSASPSPSPTPSRTSASPSPSRTATDTGPSPSASGTPRSTSQGTVRSYDTDGGLVVFDLGKVSASLVSATPGAGWSMQVWKTESWIRVEFSSGTDRVSVFCTWHDGPPRVEVGTY